MIGPVEEPSVPDLIQAPEFSIKLRKFGEAPKSKTELRATTTELHVVGLGVPPGARPGSVSDLNLRDFPATLQAAAG
jgi:hypothetical protein